MARRARSRAARTAGQELEDPFRQRVEQLARFYGWLVYHTHDSRRSAPGFPDDVFVRPPELLFVEFKTDTGRLRPEQTAWLDALGKVADAVTGEVAELERAADENTPAVEVHVWRPRDWEVAHARLSIGRRRVEPLGAL